MKLSDIKGERALDVVADLIAPICNLAQDDAVKALMTRETLPEGADVYAVAVARLKKHVPALIKTHKDDLIVILATIEGVTPAEYKLSLTLGKLIADCAALLTDTEFMELFFSAQQEGQTPSGAARVTTTEASV